MTALTRDDLFRADSVIRGFLGHGSLSVADQRFLDEQIDQIPVRDIVWAHLAPGSDRAAALVVRLTQDRPDAAAAWFLAGFQAWLDGLWADAKAALARIDEIDPAYTAGRLLYGAVTHRVPGATWKPEPEEAVAAVVAAFSEAESST